MRGKEYPPLRLASQDFAPGPGLAEPGYTATSLITEAGEETKEKLGLVGVSEEERKEGWGRADGCGVLDERVIVERMR